MTRHTRRRLPALLLAGAFVAVMSTPVSAGAADGDRQGEPGFCADGDGVTVVVDFGELGDDPVVRCAPGDKERNGLEALQDAGFDFEVSKAGAGILCRIQNSPAPDEQLEVDGKSGYTESCTEMPSASAYWSYWTAEAGGEWGYSKKGPDSSDASSGSFEGWSFALNATPETDTTPRIDPALPSGDAADATSGTQNGVQWTGGASDAGQDTADEAAADDSGSIAPWIAAAVIIVLAVLIVVTTLRRRAARTT